MTKKSEGRPKRLSVKKQAVKTGGEGGKRRRSGPVPDVVQRTRTIERIRKRPKPDTRER